MKAVRAADGGVAVVDVTNRQAPANSTGLSASICSSDSCTSPTAAHIIGQRARGVRQDGTATSSRHLRAAGCDQMSNRPYNLCRPTRSVPSASPPKAAWPSSSAPQPPGCVRSRRGRDRATPACRSRRRSPGTPFFGLAEDRAPTPGWPVVGAVRSACLDVPAPAGRRHGHRHRARHRNQAENRERLGDSIPRKAYDGRRRRRGPPARLARSVELCRPPRNVCSQVHLGTSSYDWMYDVSLARPRHSLFGYAAATGDARWRMRRRCSPGP